MLDVEFYEEARLEIEEAAAWYDEQEVSGLGDRLVVEIRAALHKARTLPIAYPLIDSRNRRVLLDKLPYGLFFREERDRILVVAFFHSKRDPIHRSSLMMANGWDGRPPPDARPLSYSERALPLHPAVKQLVDEYTEGLRTYDELVDGVFGLADRWCWVDRQNT